MPLSDHAIGTIAHFLAVAFFAYYFLWIGVTPFIDASHFTQSLFPPREYAFCVPGFIITLFAVGGTTVGSVHLIIDGGATAARLAQEKPGPIGRPQVLDPTADDPGAALPPPPVGAY